MKQKLLATFLTASCLGMLLAAASTASAAVLVGNVFLYGYDGWTDPIPTASIPTASAWPNWGILLDGDKCLSESSDGRVGEGAQVATPDGKYKPFLLVNDYQVPTANSIYHVKATLSAWDDDGFGVVFGYTDIDNYFRVGLRAQANGTNSRGFGQGVGVQKVVGGTITQINAPVTTFVPPFNNTPILVDVAVNSATGAYSVTINNNATPIQSGTDSDLITAGRKYGVLNWYQFYTGTTTLYRGTEVRSLSVTDGNDNQIKSHTFTNASPVAWKPLVMKDATGAKDTGMDAPGNFKLDFRSGKIVDDSNGYAWATTTKPNVDFIGPAVIVDDSNSAAWANYEMKVRLKTADNDGIGLLVRAATDVNGDATAFYRVNFANESMGTGTTRAPKGMSIQKFLNGTWTEIFRDNQTTPLFTYIINQVFDVKVTAVGNTLGVQVIQDPDGTPVVIDYPLQTDADSPILTGSVGFTNWGNGNAYNPATPIGGSEYSAYGGVAGTPLLVEIPEPSTIVLLGMSLIGLIAWARRRNRK